jgi:multicomponent Na+:H+ antiporter subunit C
MRDFEMEALLQEIIGRYNYWIYVILMMIGFYAMIGKRNLVKKLLGMNIFQTAIILFFVSTGVKRGGGIPIVDKYQALESGVDVSQIVNPLPHVLMLTAIVVSVSVTGVALAVLLRIYRKYGTLEEDEILERISE